METPWQAIPARETERMMKLQEVILKAMAKKLSWIEAAEIAGPLVASGYQVLNDSAGHIRQPEITAAVLKGELLVI